MPPLVHGLGLIVSDQQVFLDDYPAADSKVFATGHRRQTGGPVPTALAQLRRFDVDCRFLSAWGDDPLGQELESDLRETGIEFDLAYCRSTPHTGFAHVWIEPSTGRRTIVSVPPVGTPDRAVAATFGSAAPVLHLDGWGGDAAIAAAEATRSAGGLITFDCGSAKPTTERLLQLADIVNAPRRFITSRFGHSDLETAARQLLALGPRLVTITDGKHGAGVYTRDFAEWHEAFPVEAVDTCGAGDVFCGGLIFAHLAKKSPRDCLRFAMATAALKVSRIGNRSALASRDELEGFLKAHPT